MPFIVMFRFTYFREVLSDIKLSNSQRAPAIGFRLGIWILDCMGICRISCSPSGVLLQVKSAVLDSFFKSNMQKIQVLTFTLLHAHACSVSIARLSIRLIRCCCRTPYPGAQYYGLSVRFILPCSLAALPQFQTFDFKFLFISLVP